MSDELEDNSETEAEPKQKAKASLNAPHKERKKNVTRLESIKEKLTISVRQETLERIRSGEKTTFKRYLDDDEFAKEVLVTINGEVKLSSGQCPFTAKNISSIKLVCDKESLVKKVTKISFRSGLNPQGKTAWKIIFHF